MSEKKPIDAKPIKDLLKEKDAFLTTSEKIQEYALRHTKGFIIAAVAVVMVIAGAAIYLNAQKKADQEALLAYEDGLSKIAESQDLGIEAMEKIRADYKGQKVARLAAYKLIGLYMIKKEPDKALPLAEELLKTITPAEASLKPVLLVSLGGLYEQAKNYQLAAQSYETLLVIDQLNPNLKLNSLMALARVYRAADRKDEAIKNYERVISEYPKSFQAFMANSKLAELKGKPVAFPLPPNNLMMTAGGSASAAGTPQADENAVPAPDEAGDGAQAVEVESGAPLPPDSAPAETGTGEGTTAPSADQ